MAKFQLIIIIELLLLVILILLTMGYFVIAKYAKTCRPESYVCNSDDDCCNDLDCKYKCRKDNACCQEFDCKRKENLWWFSSSTCVPKVYY
ncbi:hypothetical protein KQX54_017429 [Cotesia glomerata]|uniref:Uncharacterized protein n=1 Tax=Cotesia glomerata TaxID=32391 RepID=A0AAV7IEF2_COTGL|nr:hypothetical protein KQX54_017429 [Cotesia glomerata]